jgi:hypothetical protein
MKNTHFILGLLALCCRIGAQPFFHVLPESTGQLEMVEFRGIPFAVEPAGKGYKNLFPQFLDVDQMYQQDTVRAVFCLGMVTDRPEGSEWWGPAERWHAHHLRLFIGDQLGKIFIVYSDTTVDVIPIIFGVNLWNYELFTQVSPTENYLNTYGGPYPEPFLSDGNARSMLDASLRLMDNDTIKGGRYILGIRTRDKPVRQVRLYNDNLRFAGVYMTAITCSTGSIPAQASADLVNARFFNRKEYYTAMDRLARRLYQYLDEIPVTDPYLPPAGYNGPVVKFTGTPLAEVFSNVYTHNIHDMHTKKVGPEGSMHTSSGDLPNFGIYVGMGTYSDQHEAYYTMVWTRDVGRCMTEIIESGENLRAPRAGDEALRLLYDPSARFSQPNWKRIANASELNNEGLWRSVGGKENDGHAAMMMFLYKLIQHRCVDGLWVQENWGSLTDAAEWICWQMDHPERSGFDRVLSSETEAATQENGAFDLYSNYYAYTGLRAFAKLAGEKGDGPRRDRWNRYADVLLEGIYSEFTTEHPRYGSIFVDNTYDCWTWEYKRFIPLFMAADLYSYDLSRDDRELYDLCRNTYLAQKEDYFSYAAGRQMGYGQGFITQASIMMDEFEDMQGYLEQAAAFCYHHSDYNYIVPEGVIMHPSGGYWYRNSDLGNNVQQAEIIKCARLLIGLDDLDPASGLNLVPRLPAGWNNMSVTGYPVAVTDFRGHPLRSVVDYSYRRSGTGYHLTLECSDDFRLGVARIGPFSSENIRFNGSKWPFETSTVNGQTFVYLDLHKNRDRKIELEISENPANQHPMP